MGIYRGCVLPWVCDLAMRNRRLAPYRERVVAAAEGRVLEIGIGSGLNLPFYRSQTQELLGLEPGPRLIKMARRIAQDSKRRVNFIEGSAEAIPLESHVVDTVLTTWTLCTIPNAGAALTEMRRVLRPGGRLLFVEHGLAPDRGVRKWQDRLTPIWSHISGGCHLNRPIRVLIENAGFRIDRLDTGYMPGPKLMAFMYEGGARPN
jgi:ubiquinone/menaquinone biosynthesis C-methylase UbiE